MEPLWKEKREIEEKPQIGKKLVEGAVKDMNAARAAVERQKKEILRLQEALKEAEAAIPELEVKVEETVKVVQDKKDQGLFCFEEIFVMQCFVHSY